MTTAPTADHAGNRHRRPRVRRFVIVAGILLAIGLIVAIIGALTPWPSAMLIRSVFEKGGAATVAEMEPYVTDTKLTEFRDIAYAPPADGRPQSDTTLDVFTPADGTTPLTTIVWIHGGAWISGEKENVEPYLRILAAEGYTTIAVAYSIAPEAVYPTAVNQLNDALAYISEHASEWNGDADRLVLAGDSAGAQLASQMAVLTTNPDYAHLLGITPGIDADQLVGAILNCGVYDLPAMAELNGIEAWGLKIALWAYAGTKDWSSTSTGATMSTIDFVTADFPPTFISGGNGDALTWLQSIPMSQALEAADVPVTKLFWSANHEPSLPHEYQFHLDLEDAHVALADTLDYLSALDAQLDAG
ncbi:MAG TPA: alpha/beta hydrolase [Plantibacter sp.]|uniref:alpha/beta hydrolase n=1 Tax=unclassified Plantibacter TaxID=2624265 RepID=UPI002BE4D644|nr:alpha/beta hydrolase [Plantibacter sp.]